MNWKERYKEAHHKYTLERTPSIINDGLYCDPKYPNVKKSNGLTQMICNYINWSGYRATRINTTGRLIDGKQKQPSGAVLTVKKWIPGTTRRGTADISCTYKGKAIQFEIKIGKDKPSEYQLAEQAKEIKAGGFYFFVSTPEQFFEYLDQF